MIIYRTTIINLFNKSRFYNVKLITFFKLLNIYEKLILLYYVNLRFLSHTSHPETSSITREKWVRLYFISFVHRF